MMALLGCPDEPTAADPVVFPETIPAPVDQEITVLPVAGIGSEAFPWIQPVAVGVEFDAVVRPDGSLAGYTLDAQSIPPRIYLHFAAEEWFDGTGDEDKTLTCYAWGWWQPTSPADLASFDGAEFYADYQGAFELEGHDCGELLDPALHGEDGGAFVSRFDGLELGIGFATLTQQLEENWPDSILQTWGDAMLSSYVALPASDGSFVAQDLSTTFAIALEPSGSQVSTDADGELVSVDIATTDTLPAFYAYSVATFYVTLDSLNLP